ncbi:130_t:CDS:1, partial [Paraglomus brasilianum]
SNEEFPKLPGKSHKLRDLISLFNSTYQNFEVAHNFGNHKEKNKALFLNGLILDEIARKHSRTRGIGSSCLTAYKRAARKYYQFAREFGNVKILNEPCSHYAFGSVSEEVFEAFLEEMHDNDTDVGTDIKGEGGSEDCASSAEEGETEEDEDDSSVDMTLHDSY